MRSQSQFWPLGAVGAAIGVLIAGACGGDAFRTPTTPSSTVAIAISPTLLPASVHDPTGLRGRYLITPSVTFSAVGTASATVKEVRFDFLVDADQVIQHGALLVHGGNLRDGPITQRYPLTFDVPVHFPNLRLRLTATFADEGGIEMETEPAEAAIQVAGVIPPH